MKWLDWWTSREQWILFMLASAQFLIVSPNNPHWQTDGGYRPDVQTLRTAWTAGLTHLWSEAQNPAEDQSLAGLWSLLEPILLHTFNDGWDDGTECILSKPAGNTKLEGVIGEPDSCAALHRDLKRLDKWAYSILSCIRNCCQQAEGGDSPCLFSTGETKLGITCPVQDFLVRETQT